MKKSSSQSGFVLLEALIGILIFSLGILGIIAFQAAAAKITAESRYRTEAALYADELIAQMRASAGPSLPTDFDPAGSGNKYSTWLNKVKAAATGLPGGDVTMESIAVDAATNTYLISFSVKWVTPGENTQDSGTYSTTALIDPN